MTPKTKLDAAIAIVRGPKNRASWLFFERLLQTARGDEAAFIGSLRESYLNAAFRENPALAFEITLGLPSNP